MGNSSGSCIGGGESSSKTGSDERQRDPTSPSKQRQQQKYGAPATGNEKYAVKLRVYNLQPADQRGRKHINTSLGFGFFHSAIEVFGVEWQFGGNQTAAPEDSGIFFVPPEVIMPPNQVYEVVHLGYLPTGATHAIIAENVQKYLLPNWTALSYHILQHNCNHFSEAFVDMLRQVFGLEGGDDLKPFPSFVNRAARFGDVFVPDAVIEQMMRAAPQAPTQGGSNQNPKVTSPNSKRKLGKNPTITKPDGRHYTIDGIPLKTFQGWGAGQQQHHHPTSSSCMCGNPMCPNNPYGFAAQARRRQQEQQQQQQQKHKTSSSAEDEETSLPPIPTDDEMKHMPVKKLKTVMWLNGISWEDCVEKEDLINAVRKYRVEIEK